MQIELENVSKSWGEVCAVDKVSFTAQASELLVVLGPSGCGKSTILRLIAGLESVSTGTIQINGLNVTTLPPAKRNVSMVFQSYALFPHLNVAENIVFGLKVRRTPEAERKARLARVAEQVGLAELLDRKPQQLSGGQRQRVALARAIIAENRICLMDEPLSNLDAHWIRILHSFCKTVSYEKNHFPYVLAAVLIGSSAMGQFNFGKKKPANNPPSTNQQPSTVTNKVTGLSKANATAVDTSLKPKKTVDTTTVGGFEETTPRNLRNNTAVERTITREKKPLAYEHLREDAWLYSEMIWREIDAREKMNQTFMYPGKDERRPAFFCDPVESHS